MTLLDKFRGAPASLLQEATLETLLIDMQRYGQPRLGVFSTSGTWHCGVEMTVNAVGAQFKIDSDFKQPTPLAAVKQCHERMVQALKTLGVAHG